MNGFEPLCQLCHKHCLIIQGKNVCRIGPEQCDQIWRNSPLWQKFEDLFLVPQNFKFLTFSILLHFIVTNGQILKQNLTIWSHWSRVGETNIFRHSDVKNDWISVDNFLEIAFTTFLRPFDGLNLASLSLKVLKRPLKGV